jgi:preprotein translocase subunit SecG
MTIVFLALVLIAAIVLGFIILVQNPKGGGLSGNIAGFSNQFMGVKQTTDVLEKGTWIFAGVIALLCLFSTFFMKGGTNNDDNILNKINTSQGTSAPRTTTPAAGQPVPVTPAPRQ